MLPAYLFWVWIFKEPGLLCDISEVLGEGGAADWAFLKTVIDILSRSLGPQRVIFFPYKSDVGPAHCVCLAGSWLHSPAGSRWPEVGHMPSPPHRPAMGPHPSATLLPERKAW